jgi:hypothetical protein
MKTVNIALPYDLHEALKQRARRERRSLRSEIATLLAEFAANDPTMCVKLPSDARGIQ